MDGLWTGVDLSRLALTKQMAESGRQLQAGRMSLEELASSVTTVGGSPGGILQHSVATAFAARELCQQRGGAAGPVMAAAVLHDIGLLALAEAGREASSPAIHAAAGGDLLQRWDFPADVVTAVTCYRRVTEAGDHERLAAFCYFGDMLAGFLGVVYPLPAFDPRSRNRVLDVLGVKPDDMPQWIRRTQAAFAGWRK